MVCQLRRVSLWWLALIPLLGFCDEMATLPVIRVGTILQIQQDHPVVRLMRQAYAELEMNMELELMPAERVFRELKLGRLLDATLAATQSVETKNPDLVRVPVVIYNLELSVYSSDPKLKITEWSELQPYHVVVLKGVAAVQQQLAHNQDQQIEAVLSIQQALRLVELGRNELAVLPKTEAEAMLNKLQLKKVRVLTPSLSVIPAYHYVHNKNRAFVQPLAQILSKLTGHPIEQNELPEATSAASVDGKVVQ
jgi:polar amino acid transport system substrate-binding protein